MHRVAVDPQGQLLRCHEPHIVTGETTDFRIRASDNYFGGRTVKLANAFDLKPGFRIQGSGIRRMTPERAVQESVILFTTMVA